MGPPETAARRLNFAQTFNPLGSMAGVVLGGTFILSGIEMTPEQTAALSPAARDAWIGAELGAVERTYLLIAAVTALWAVLVALVRFPVPHAAEAEGGAGHWSDYRAVLADGRVRAGVFAQFCYVGAQVGLWSYLIRYAQAEVPGMGEKDAAALLTLALGLFFVGRFAGTAAMGRVPPATLLALFAAVDVVLALVAGLVGGVVGLGALILASLFMSIMFPTIFALTVRGLGPRTKAASSLLVMAIIGGAVLTALMGWLSDASSTIRWAMLVPAAAFAVVLAYARMAGAERRARP